MLELKINLVHLCFLLTVFLSFGFEERSHPFLSEQMHQAGRESLFAGLSVPVSGLAGLQEFSSGFLKTTACQAGKTRP